MAIIGGHINTVAAGQFHGYADVRDVYLID